MERANDERDTHPVTDIRTVNTAETNRIAYT